MKGYREIAVAFIWVWLAPLLAQNPPQSKSTEPIYIGVKKCRTCHRKKEQGAQYRLWLKGPHSKAYKTLASEKARKIAAQKGISDPQKAPECLKCHVTAYGVDPSRLGPKYRIQDGVGCESCHGAGGNYYKKKTMRAITAGKLDPASVGLIKPDEQVCQKCHNPESPTFKEFNYEEAVKKIEHPIPPERKEEVKRTYREDEPEEEEEEEDG